MGFHFESKDELLKLATDLHDGLLDEDGMQEIEHRLEASSARNQYLDYVMLHALLEAKHEPALQGIAAVQLTTSNKTEHPKLSIEDLLSQGKKGQSRGWLSAKNRSMSTMALFSLACTIGGLLLVAGLWRQTSQQGHTEPDFVAILTNTSRAKWLSDAPGEAPVRLRAGSNLQLIDGLAEVTLSSGAVVVVRGPADLELVSPMLVRALRGTVRARVGQDATGFAIETPNAEVVDLGTEFGVDVNETGETNVVVFEGEVDLAYRAENLSSTPTRQIPLSSTSRKRLREGEALHLDVTGAARRIVSIDSNYFPVTAAKWLTIEDEPVVITGIRDNLRVPNHAQYYQIVHKGLRDDVRSYVDRAHEWNGVDEEGIPKFLLGADYVMTFNSDKWQSDLEIEVELSCPASLYVFYDDRLPVPTWLAERFTDTGFDIGGDEGFPGNIKMKPRNATGSGQSIDTVHSIWQLDVSEAGTVKLGALAENKIGVSMYGIAAVAREDAFSPPDSSLKQRKSQKMSGIQILESI